MATDTGSTLSVDLTHIGSEAVRQSLRNAFDSLGCRFEEFTTFWSEFPQPSETRLPENLLVFADLSKIARRFNESRRHQWIASVRRSRPYFVTFVRTRSDAACASIIDDLLTHSDLRVSVSRELKAGILRKILIDAVASLDPNSIVEVRYSPVQKKLWVAFADGLNGFVDWRQLGIEDRVPELDLESATPGYGYKAVEITKADGGVFHIDASVLRAMFDPVSKQVLETEAIDAGQSLGRTLRLAREKAGLTQQELEATSGLAQAIISKLERGKHHPRFDTLERFARGVGLSVRDLLQGHPV